METILPYNAYYEQHDTDYISDAIMTELGLIDNKDLELWLTANNDSNCILCAEHESELNW